MGSRDQLFIVDGHSMIFRAVFKHGPPLTSPDGEPTRGTYYFCRMLFALVDDHRPAYLAMAVDAPRKSTWRRALYPPYKMKRDDLGPPPEEVIIQMTRIKEIVKALGVPIIGAPGFEADDVIASLVDVCASDEVECVVCTRDKDLHQLVGPRCRVFDPQESEWCDEAKVLERWGVPPHQVVEVQTLAGDTIDNVPGVPGIGLKKALALVQRFGSVDAIMEAAETLTPAVQRALRAADLKLCRQLVELRRDVPLDISPAELEFNGFNMKRARPLFRQLGFKAWS